ncbi:MAG: hypothetical protein PF450_01075 [Bacteroidales bacterium]|jgi:hypothetical protein|nr:hypothetical protein [Bacteroidales bacterium]
MSGKIYAVISGELAESKKVSQEHLGKIPDINRSSFKEVNKKAVAQDKLVYEIIRMDEFLCLTDNPSSALHSILMLASEFRYQSYLNINIRADLRLSMGIGPVELFQRELRESDGTAFRSAYSGLKSMKRNQRLLIETENHELNEELIVGCGFMDILIHDWSDEQAEAMLHRLSGKNQTQISEELNISQPAVNRRLKAAHYEAIERFIHRFTALLS